MLADGLAALPVSLSAPIWSSSSPVCLGWRASGLSSVACRSSGSSASETSPGRASVADRSSGVAGLGLAGSPDSLDPPESLDPLESSDALGSGASAPVSVGTSTDRRRPAVRSWVLLTQRLVRYTGSGSALSRAPAIVSRRVASASYAGAQPSCSRARAVSIRTGMRNAWIHSVPAGVYGSRSSSWAVRSTPIFGSSTLLQPISRAMSESVISPGAARL